VPFGSIHRIDIDAIDMGAADIDAFQACTP
jgi:hypothetical protein